MKIQDSTLINDVIEVFPTKMGKLFMFENIVVIEINEGVHLNSTNTIEFFTKIFSFYNGDKPIAFIANRINNYSIEVLDMNKLFNMLPNIVAYGVVYYSMKNAYNIEIEKQFSPIPYMGYINLEDAFENSLKILKECCSERLKTF